LVILEDSTAELTIETRLIKICVNYSDSISGNNVTKDIEIKIHDEGGLCSIGIVGERSDHENTDQVALIASVWKYFRSNLDSCSEGVCDCTAMNAPVWSSKECVERDIAEIFLRTLEWRTDSPISLRWKGFRLKWRKSWREVERYNGVTKTNSLYMGRFLEIYSARLTGFECELKKTMDARSDKAEIIYDFSAFEADLNFKTFRIMIAVSVGLGVAVLTIILRLYSII